MVKNCLKHCFAASVVILLCITTTIASIPIFIIGFLKLIPYQPWSTTCTKVLEAIATAWVHVNTAFIDLALPTRWEVHGEERLKRKDWYLVISNHQSWLDIVVLQKVFNHKIPMLKFFVKDQLKWVPLLGFAWWALDCPFMKRHSRAYLKKYPHKRGSDLRATQKACEKFKNKPVTIMNFVEGSRFTKEKRQQQQSPYQNLLKPKAGGAAFVLKSLGGQLKTVLDITIVYPEGDKSLWSFLRGDISDIKVFIKRAELSEGLLGRDYLNDAEAQGDFRSWLNQMWDEKDALITRTLESSHSE